MPIAERASIALDTSVVIAGLLSWHRDHHRALPLLESALGSGTALLPSRVLIESYSVMTRMPAPHRLAPATALDLLAGTLSEAAALVDFPPQDRWSFLENLAQDGISGGAAYDAEIVAAATRAGASRLLTLNARHFERLAPAELEIVSRP